MAGTGTSVALIVACVLCVTACASDSDKADTKPPRSGSTTSHAPSSGTPPSSTPSPRMASVVTAPSPYFRGDPSGDMASIHGDQEIGLDDARPALPSKQIADIVRTRLNLTSSELHIRVRYRDPDSSLDNGWRFSHVVSVHTNDGIRRSFEYIFDRSGRHDAHTVSGRIEYNHPGRCRLAWFGEDLLEISVPSRCLGDPEWVRVAVQTAVWVDDGRRETFAWDDSFGNGLRAVAPDEYEVFSPRVRVVD